MAESYDKRLVAKVVKLRDRDELSWLHIKEAVAEGKTGIEVSASTVRRMYDTGKGHVGAHREVSAYVLPGGRRAPGFGTPEYDPAATLKSKKAESNGSEPKPKSTSEKRTQRSTKAKAPAKSASKTKVQKDTVTETVPPAEPATAHKGAASKAVKANA